MTTRLQATGCALALVALMAATPLRTSLAAEVTAALPELGAPEAASLPNLDSGATLDPGPDPTHLRLDKWVPYFPPHSPANDARAAAEVAASAVKLPTWTGRVTSLGKNYNFTMAGGTPLGNGAGTTTIKVVVIPLRFVFSNATFDAASPFAGCSPAGATTMVAQSPLIRAISFAAGSIKVGTSQYTDLFQRANFWGYVSHGNPNYHTLLSARQAPKVTITVNGSASGVFCTNGRSGAEGSVDITQFDALVRSRLIPQLSAYVNPGELALFLSYDVVFGGAYGYHNAYATPNGAQTYAVSAYLDVDASAPNVEVLSHELGEFLDDPLVNNPTPAWGHTGQVRGCQANLEVGDPLSGLSFGSAKMPNGYTYTVQDLTFFSWFYREVPSFGVGGRYTMFNYFRNPQPLCH